VGSFLLLDNDAMLNCWEKVHGNSTKGRDIFPWIYSKMARTFSSSNRRPINCKEIGSPSNSFGSSISSQPVQWQDRLHSTYTVSIPLRPFQSVL
jgi:hypothetical protein